MHSAPTVLFGSFIKLENAYVYDIRVVDVAGEKLVSSLQAKAENFDFLLEATKEIVAELDGAPAPKPIPEVKKAPENAPIAKEEVIIPPVPVLKEENIIEKRKEAEAITKIPRNNKRAFILEVNKDKAVFDIGRQNKVKKRMLYDIYEGKKKIKRGEIKEVGFATSTADFKGRIDESYAKNPNVHGKLVGRRWVFGFGPSPAAGFSSDRDDVVLSFSMALHLFTKIGLGIEWDLGVFNAFSHEGKGRRLSQPG